MKKFLLIFSILVIIVLFSCAMFKHHTENEYMSSKEEKNIEEEPIVIIIDPDPRDFDNLEVLCKVDTPGNPQNIQVNNNHAYIADCEEGVQIIDFSDFDNAGIINNINIPEEDVYNICVYNNYTYIPLEFEEILYVVNCSDLENLQTKKYNYPGSPAGFIVHNGKGYVPSSGLFESGLDELNILDNDNITLNNSIEHSLLIINSYYINDNYAFVGSFGNLVIFDLNKNEVVKDIKITTSISGISAKDNYVYVSAETNGFYIIDISDIENLSTDNIIKNIPAGYASSVFVYGNYAYFTDVFAINGLHIIDITNPSSAEMYKTIDLVENPNKVYVNEDYIFVTTKKIDGYDPGSLYVIGKK